MLNAADDYRSVLQDPTIDAIWIATPGHLHAGMSVAACEAGKDVYVETPACLSVEEGRSVVEAARRHRRIVQAGTVQRSGNRFRTVRGIVKSGKLGQIAFCRISRLESLDLVNFVFDDAPCLSVTSQRGPGTSLTTYRYPDLVVSCEARGATTFHGSRATLTVDRQGCRIHTEGAGPVSVPEEPDSASAATRRHWNNWLECIRTRAVPVAEIETCVRTDLARLYAAV